VEKIPKIKIILQSISRNGFMDMNYVGNYVWKCTWIIIIWRIWNRRNKIIFNNGVIYPVGTFWYGLSKSVSMSNL